MWFVSVILSCDCGNSGVLFGRHGIFSGGNPVSYDVHGFLGKHGAQDFVQEKGRDRQEEAGGGTERLREYVGGYGAAVVLCYGVFTGALRMLSVIEKNNYKQA